MSAYLEAGLGGRFPVATDNSGMAQLLAVYGRQIYNDLDLLMRCYNAVAQHRDEEQGQLAEAEQIAYEVLPRYSPAARLRLAKFCLKPWPISDLPSG